ncbi:MAG: hypothetical protein IJI35_15220, partial [Kiritimatiellae bacterium]|nr:hypothetical protein [Kiritimatiellia bacterium]
MKICNYGNTQCPCGAGQQTRTGARDKRVTRPFPQFLAAPIHPAVSLNGFTATVPQYVCPSLTVFGENLMAAKLICRGNHHCVLFLHKEIFHRED